MSEDFAGDHADVVVGHDAVDAVSVEDGVDPRAMGWIRRVRGQRAVGMRVHVLAPAVAGVVDRVGEFADLRMPEELGRLSARPVRRACPHPAPPPAPRILLGPAAR